MSKGNKESKKPKRVPVGKAPGVGVATPTPATASRPQPHKKWPTQ